MNDSRTPDAPALPFNPETKDIACRKVDGEWQCNVPHRHVHHSKAGMSWGHNGYGSADLALNVMAVFLGPAPPIPPIPGVDASHEEWDAWITASVNTEVVLDGSYVHRDAWRLHQDFKRAFIATLPEQGGIIPGATIQAWINATLPRVRERDDRS